MTDTFSFNWNTVANLIMALGTIGLFVIARRKQKSDVRIVTDPVSIEHCTQIHKGTDQQIEILKQKFNELKNTREAERFQTIGDQNRVYKHIESVRRELSEKIDNQPAALIAMLRNTKARFDQ